MTNEIVEVVAKAVTTEIERLMPTIIKGVITAIKETLTKELVERIDKNETRYFQLRDETHRILESAEIARNKQNSSDLIVYGVKEDGSKPTIEITGKSLYLSFLKLESVQPLASI